VSKLDAVRQAFLAHGPLLEASIARDQQTDKGWTIWTLFNDQGEGATIILDYDGIQIAHAPLSEYAVGHIQAAACWLQQWRRVIDSAFNRGEQEGLWLTSALLRLFRRVQGDIPGLYIETAPRVG
jgi:hypothetical protein